jgi:hypothetical protein
MESVSQVAGGMSAAVDRTEAANEVRSYARMAGAALLVALASIVVLYGGSGAIAGTRPDNATTGAGVSAFYNHPELAWLFWQTVISVVGLAFFALAFRRYLAAFATRPLAHQLVDLGAALVLVEISVAVVQLGLQLSLVRLAGLADTSLLGVFMAWTWIDNGTMLWVEFAWLGTLSLAAWMTGALPRWLAGFGLVVALLLLVFAVPGLMFGYPVGVSFVAYGPFMAWFLITGIYLVRGGRKTLDSPSA